MQLWIIVRKLRLPPLATAFLPFSIEMRDWGQVSGDITSISELRKLTYVNFYETAIKAPIGLPYPLVKKMRERDRHKLIRVDAMLLLASIAIEVTYEIM